MAEISLASKNKDLDDGNKSTDQSLDDDTEARVKSTVHGNADTPEDILTAINSNYCTIHVQYMYNRVKGGNLDQFFRIKK